MNSYIRPAHKLTDLFLPSLKDVKLVTFDCDIDNVNFADTQLKKINSRTFSTEPISLFMLELGDRPYIAAEGLPYIINFTYDNRQYSICTQQYYLEPFPPATAITVNAIKSITVCKDLFPIHTFAGQIEPAELVHKLQRSIWQNNNLNDIDIAIIPNNLSLIIVGEPTTIRYDINEKYNHLAVPE